LVWHHRCVSSPGQTYRLPSGKTTRSTSLNRVWAGSSYLKDHKREDNLQDAQNSSRPTF
jgi:hypothetical protein